MKTTFKTIALSCALFFGANSFGQTLTLGVTGGYNASTYQPFNFEDTYHGWNTGLTAIWSSTTHWGIGGDLTFTQSGGLFSAVPERRFLPYEYRVKSDYIRLTPKFHYFFGDLEDNLRPTVFVGPSVGFLTGAQTQASEAHMHRYFYPAEFSGVVGGGINYQILSGFWIHANANYTIGITEANRLPVEEPNNLRTNNLGINLGVAYSFNSIKESTSEIAPIE